MVIRRFISVFLTVICVTGAAKAADWKVQSLEGSARSFAHGEWSGIAPAAALAPNTTVETAADGQMRLGRGDDMLTVGANAKIRVEQLKAPLVRVLEGALDAEIAAGGERLALMTTYAEIDADDADFTVAIEPDGATVSVRRGAVSVTDLATLGVVTLQAGEILHVRGGEPNVPQLASAPAVPARGIELTTRVDPDKLGKPLDADAAAVERATALLRDEKRKAFGAGGAKADAGRVEDAVGALHEEKRKAKIGKADPRTIAAVAKLERELFQDVDYEAEPWDNSFEWTEVEDGVVRLKPISRVILNLSAPESYEFWFLAFITCLFLGAGASAVMERVGMGTISNGAVVALAFVTAVIIRDLFFRSGGNVSIEPFLSIGMLLAAATAALVGGAAAKTRLG